LLREQFSFLRLHRPILIYFEHFKSEKFSYRLFA
jgi:hypothetical protein